MARRRKNGQFIPGKSGNPKGRPSSNTMMMRSLLSENVESIITVIRNAALRGDLQACKLILDRVLPPLKAQALPWDLSLPDKLDLIKTAETFIQEAAK